MNVRFYGIKVTMSKDILGKSYFTRNQHCLNRSIHSPVHDKKHFQVERIAFFSDAIIAIASALLILEFKIPSLGRDHAGFSICTSHFEAAVNK